MDMSRAVLHLLRRENYAKYEISMSYGNIQADNVIGVESPRQLRYARESRKRLATTDTANSGVRQRNLVPNNADRRAGTRAIEIP